ncbi:MAG: hypothetical protein ABIH49_02335 [archaeon]
MNSEKEWNFITKETHKEKPTKENLLKREMLFALQVLLASRYEIDREVYWKVKGMYFGEGCRPPLGGTNFYKL